MLLQIRRPKLNKEQDVQVSDTTMLKKEQMLVSKKMINN
jgi:hypothetical protein